MLTGWDSRIPATAAEIIALLERRIEVHTAWRDWIASGDADALEASRRGVGTVKSHQTYIDQYRGAIGVLAALQAEEDRRDGC